MMHRQKLHARDWNRDSQAVRRPWDSFICCAIPTIPNISSSLQWRFHHTKKKNAKGCVHGRGMAARLIKMSVCTSAHFSKIAAQCAMEAFRAAAARFLGRASEDPSSSCRPPKSSLCSSSALACWLFTVPFSYNGSSL